MIGDISTLIDALETAPVDQSIKTWFFHDIARGSKNPLLLSYCVKDDSGSPPFLLARIGVLGTLESYGGLEVYWQLSFTLTSSLECDPLAFNVVDPRLDCSQYQENVNSTRSTSGLTGCSALAAAQAIVESGCGFLPDSRTAAMELAITGNVGAFGDISEVTLYRADERDVCFEGTHLMSLSSTQRGRNLATISAYVTRKGEFVGYRHNHQPVKGQLTTRFVMAMTPEELMEQLGYGDLEKELYNKLGWKSV